MPNERLAELNGLTVDDFEPKEDTTSKDIEILADTVLALLYSTGVKNTNAPLLLKYICVN